MENSTFVTDEEITEYLNQELAELHGRIKLAEGQPHFRSSRNISVTNGTALYALPVDFLSVQRMTCVIDGITRDMEPFMEGERSGLLNSHLVYPYSLAPRYRIQAGNIEILPSTRTFTATLWYVSSCPRLEDGSDTFDGFNGYEVAAIFGTCATMLAKEESDPSFYLGQKERIYRHIDAMAAQRDASHPERVTDVHGSLDAALRWW